MEVREGVSLSVRLDRPRARSMHVVARMNAQVDMQVDKNTKPGRCVIPFFLKTAFFLHRGHCLPSLTNRSVG